MNVNQINHSLTSENPNFKEVLPHYGQYRQRVYQLPFDFGLNQLPNEPGMISVRGPRQYGKSTWLESQVVDTWKAHGPGSVFYLNGDDYQSVSELSQAIEELTSSYSVDCSTKRLFIDEITAISGWEKAIKKISDRGLLKDILIVTTGSQATDLLRGSERLPGRKGKLKKTQYTFLPISYRDFYDSAHEVYGKDCWKVYLLTGGSPFALSEMYPNQELPTFLTEVTRDWVLGEVAAKGRSRTSLSNILKVLYRFGGSPVGYAKLARESGLSNNTVASGYIELLNELMCVMPSYQWDNSRKIPILRKPCKFPFINLSMAIAFHPSKPHSLQALKNLSSQELSILLEWLVAQELWRREAKIKKLEDTSLNFWKSEKNEIDFVSETQGLHEVKLGKSKGIEFGWFSHTFPGEKLSVINANSFETQGVKGMTLHNFLYYDS